MENVISAQELKRRGISAVDAALKKGPVHVIRRNRPSYVILSEEEYRRLTTFQGAAERLWDRLLAEETRSGGRRASQIDKQVNAERESWER